MVCERGSGVEGCVVEGCVWKGCQSTSEYIDPCLTRGEGVRVVCERGVRM